MKFTEKVMEVLLELKNANILGHLTYMDILSMALALNPNANFSYIKVIKGFNRDVTEIVLDPHVNHYCSAIIVLFIQVRSP